MYCEVMAQGKVGPVQAMKLYGNWIYILKDLLPQPWMEVSGMVQASAAFHPEPGGSQWWTGNSEEEKYTLPLLLIQ